MSRFISAISIAVLLLAASYASAETVTAVPEKSFGASAGENKAYNGLKEVYLIGLGLVGISALFVIVWGGLDYITARDSATGVERGKKRIKNGLAGIALAAVSYIILYTINPDLVKLNIREAERRSIRGGGGQEVE